MQIVKSFRELNTYKLAREAAGRIFQITKPFPAEEKYSLTDQIRRSSRAVNAMIAAAWEWRRYRAVFVNKLDEALEETMETQAWLDHSLDSGYISETQFRTLDAQWQSVGAMLNRMMERADAFCKFAPDDTDHVSRSRR
jgi:four helix bundle protein